MDERKRKFAEVYSLTANARQSAIAAGYASGSAHVLGSRLVRDKFVQKHLAANLVDVKTHAQQTYNKMIRLAEEAMALLDQAKAGGDLREIGAAIECAGRQIERLARAEGLILPPIRGEGQDGQKANLQTIIQVVSQHFNVPHKEPMVVIEAPLQKAIPTNGTDKYFDADEQPPVGPGESVEKEDDS